LELPIGIPKTLGLCSERGDERSDLDRTQMPHGFIALHDVMLTDRCAGCQAAGHALPDIVSA